VKTITKIILILVALINFLCSCKKEKCKECFLDETNSNTGQTVTTSIGKKCGNELKETDGKEYRGSDGPVKSYCK